MTSFLDPTEKRERLLSSKDRGGARGGKGGDRPDFRRALATTLWGRSEGDAAPVVSDLVFKTGSGVARRMRGRILGRA